MQVSDGGHVYITLDEKLALADMGSKYRSCIFRVHNVLRNQNPRAYDPEIVAIGPYHRHRTDLKMMEEHKLRLLRTLLDRKSQNVSAYLTAMGEMEREARECYAEPIALVSNEFVEMMVLDGCFLIELISGFQMLKHSRGDKAGRDDDPLFRMGWIINSLQRDLMLFENQLPFFVLKKLYEMIVDRSDQQYIFMDLALEFFNDLFPGKGNKSKTQGLNDVRHLLDLIHRNWSSDKIKPNVDVTWNMENLELIPCCTQLEVAGIRFDRIDRGASFDVVFDEKGSLRIPSLTIEDRTECFLRNLIALEQYSGDARFNIITDYVALLGCLVQSESDFMLLIRRGIVRNFAGAAGEVVSRMFKGLSDSVAGPSGNFLYAGIFRRVNIHCRRPVNRWMASLRRNYFITPWGIISGLAGSALLLLALLQVIYLIKSCKH